MSNETPETTSLTKDDTLAVAEAVGVVEPSTDEPPAEVTETPAAPSSKRVWIAFAAVVAFVAVVAGLFFFSAKQDNDAAKKTEAAVTKYLTEQGATVEAVDCT